MFSSVFVLHHPTILLFTNTIQWENWAKSFLPLWIMSYSLDALNKLFQKKVTNKFFCHQKKYEALLLRETDKNLQPDNSRIHDLDNL